jgi:hypothetical protein
VPVVYSLLDGARSRFSRSEPPQPRPIDEEPTQPRLAGISR